MMTDFQRDAIAAGLRTLFKTNDRIDKLLLDDLFDVANARPDAELHAIIKATHTVSFRNMSWRFRNELFQGVGPDLEKLPLEETFAPATAA